MQEQQLVHTAASQ